MKIISLFLFLSLFLFADINKKYPCDSKFGKKGNYIQFQFNSKHSISSNLLQLCFGEKENICLSLENLSGRYQYRNKWSKWKEIKFLKTGRLYQFAFCDKQIYKQIWKPKRNKLPFNILDNMMIINKTKKNMNISKFKIVQNRVKVLYKNDRIMLKPLKKFSFSNLIKQYKINKIYNLNMQMKDFSLNSIVENALKKLGHSGSIEFGPIDSAYCSEFVLYIVKNSTNLTSYCKSPPPKTYKQNIGSFTLLKYFKKCDIVIPKNKIKSLLTAGDYLSVDNRKHSVIFLGWADKEKETFWEISGNNQCIPEKETWHNPNFKSNMICITKRVYKTNVLKKDYAVALHKYANIKEDNK